MTEIKVERTVTMRLDEKIFWRDFDAMAAIGATEAGGCERLSMSDEDIKARALLISMLEEEGFAVNQDETGAIWARMEGEDPNAAAGVWVRISMSRLSVNSSERLQKFSFSIPSIPLKAP